MYLDINVCMCIIYLDTTVLDTHPPLPYTVATMAATVVVVANCWSSSTVLLDIAFRPSGKWCPVLD